MGDSRRSGDSRRVTFDRKQSYNIIFARGRHIGHCTTDRISPIRTIRKAESARIPEFRLKCRRTDWRDSLKIQWRDTGISLSRSLQINVRTVPTICRYAFALYALVTCRKFTITLFILMLFSRKTEDRASFVMHFMMKKEKVPLDRSFNEVQRAASTVIRKSKSL